MNADEKKALGIRMKKARKSAGLTQAELAKMTGIAQANISMIENGATTSLNTIITIAKICNISTDYLLGLTDDTVSLDHAFHDGRLSVISRVAGRKDSPDEAYESEYLMLVSDPVLSEYLSKNIQDS